MNCQSTLATLIMFLALYTVSKRTEHFACKHICSLPCTRQLIILKTGAISFAHTNIYKILFVHITLLTYFGWPQPSSGKIASG